MRKLMMYVAFALLVAVIALLSISLCRAEEADQKLEKPRTIDGILFNVDGSMMWIDAYINSFRPKMQYWMDEKAARKHIKRIQCEANFLVVGAGKNSEEIKTRVRNNETSEDFFRKAFCTEVETIKNGKPICEKVCVGNPDDYIILVIRMIPDSPMRNCKFLFSYIEKKVARELGCQDEDVQE